MTFNNEGEAWVALTTGTATPENLNVIASSFPQLRAQVAAHPSAYPALLDWLANLGDPAIDQALARRRSAEILNPNTDAATLQELATTRPDLLPAILQHPHCYPELAAWIRQQPDSPVQQIPSMTQTHDVPEDNSEQPATSEHSGLTAGDVAKGIGGFAAGLGIEMFQQLLSWIILGVTVIIGGAIGRGIDGGNIGGATIAGVVVGLIVGFIINYKRGYFTFFSF